MILNDIMSVVALRSPEPGRFTPADEFFVILLVDLIVPVELGQCRLHFRYGIAWASRR
jgi:hypothetical protein